MMIATLLLLQAAASANPTPPAPPPAKPKLICHSSEVLGSRLGSQRTCATAAEWEVRQREQRQSVERMQSNNMRNTGG